MPINYNEIQKDALLSTAKKMCIAARTAPKTRGIDNLEIIILSQQEKLSVISKMKEISTRDNRPSFVRDASNIENIDHIVLISTKKQTVGLNCGFCGHRTCKELQDTNGACAFNSMDLGIALGSAAALASHAHADNRLMFSIGKAAIECGLTSPDCIQAIGIPLSATGKNPFFDRK
ncbi:MAG TPA: DUF2148 domain-containing protein [Candidatus Omnitrophota bacterium]|nr:DUF2148 domain-containing protein [Candidatus Omnitrophota bacterium]HPS19882.1 DUF2148 domain-containing protein [Candidatus Omnitrophota bacterium]